ncbi:VOC family protein [Deinococcus radiophilus]|uniref:Glyoxalase/fosfomycin resistance/dioxygenase domain-containing protein n=1 Tax=Deinococcus radiophilus TaxID=32062 RepID=A0A431VUK3_9DEIO|nr:VOC family protein [Deinococcus radiophilus]RTR26830.1 hypothetical protein EJ104_07480 [Deinococcus radiophilus]UFA51805.1 VOC family protein [Deinococcus radiophilus]
MTTPVSGIHHLTGITADAQANVDFYVGLLGLRLVKRTVNHSDAQTLHLAYGDALGRPGSVLTFFAWPDTAQGRRGVGQATAIGLLASLGSLGDWMTWLLGQGVTRSGAATPPGFLCMIPTAYRSGWSSCRTPQRDGPGTAPRCRPTCSCAASTTPSSGPRTSLPQRSCWSSIWASGAARKWTAC